MIARIGSTCRRLLVASLLLWLLPSAAPAGTQSQPSPDSAAVMSPQSEPEDTLEGPPLPPDAAAAPVPFAEYAPTTAAVAAAQPPEVSAAATVDAGAGWAGWAFPTIKTVGALGLLAFLVMVGFLVLRRLAPHYFARKPDETIMRLVGTLSMGDKRSLAVVEVAGQRFLVGNTPTQISLLAPLTENAAAGDQRQQGAAAAKPTGPTVAVKRSGFLNALLAEKNDLGRAKPQADRIPPDIRGKMRELREALEA